MTQLEREQAAMQEESSPVIERYLSFLALHAVGYNWGTTRGDSLVANRRQNKAYGVRPYS
jgi:hypothetical protein